LYVNFVGQPVCLSSKIGSSTQGLQLIYKLRQKTLDSGGHGQDEWGFDTVSRLLSVRWIDFWVFDLFWLDSVSYSLAHLDFFISFIGKTVGKTLASIKREWKWVFRLLLLRMIFLKIDLVCFWQPMEAFW
jgi:hypothetical protein